MTPKTLLAGTVLSALPVLAILAFMVPQKAAATADPVLAQAQGGGPGMGGPGMGGPRGDSGPGRRAERMFQGLDTNKDGSISAEEFKAAHQNQRGMFSVLDADGDGSVSQDEFVNRREARRQARFKELDTNKDGKLGQDEYDEHLAQMFESMDDNKDGKLTPEEIGPQRGGRQ